MVVFCCDDYWDTQWLCYRFINKDIGAIFFASFSVMVKTCAGISTVPNETIVASEGLEAYLDELFDSLAVKNDISVIKQEILVLLPT